MAQEVGLVLKEIIQVCLEYSSVSRSAILESNFKIFFFVNLTKDICSNFAPFSGPQHQPTLVWPSNLSDRPCWKLFEKQTNDFQNQSLENRARYIYNKKIYA